jgi:hypothetical protein
LYYNHSFINNKKENKNKKRHDMELNKEP